MGIYFRDYYNHAIIRSWLWHYNHPDYDISHWSPQRRAEYDYWMKYYESQNIPRNPNYVDPGTNKDEDYIQSYVDKNTDKFYGQNADEYTVEELPDESQKPQLIQVSETSEPKVVVVGKQVKKGTSGAVWFVLIFGALLIVGIIVLVLYNKGYF
jgi:hypothetical protein